MHLELIKLKLKFMIFHNFKWIVIEHKLMANVSGLLFTILHFAVLDW